MNTPICDFLDYYAESSFLRAHMPGHKGENLIGAEKDDITEISGADSLYEADGIIYESEKNSSKLFGFETFYSTEGSSLCIRAIMFLCMQYAKKNNRKPYILAGRNAHKVFLNTASLLGFYVEWLFGKENGSYLTCDIDLKKLEGSLDNIEEKPVAVYITSPDYLGNISDIKKISEICRKYGVFLIVDNAHGAYLKFLPESMHPIDLGADICCDSAHKTLPVLTGGAYLHISNSMPSFFKKEAKAALAFFGSTSPSYLILKSLDRANLYLFESYKKELSEFLEKTDNLKKELTKKGYKILGNEPLKITVDIKKYGYSGIDFYEELKKRNIMCEFCDADFVVLMLSPQNKDDVLKKIKEAFFEIEKKESIKNEIPLFYKAKKEMEAFETLYLPKEKIPIEKSVGRILGEVNVSCPPAVPFIVCGERIDENTVKLFKYYGIEECKVIKE